MFKKPGGGFLNDTNGTIQDLKFDSKEWGEGDDAYTTLSAELVILPDGADEPVSQFLPAGFIYEGMSVSDDGRTIEGGEGSVVPENSEFAKFVSSFIEAGGASESDFDENGRNFDALVGKRVTFKKEINVDRQLAAGRKKLGAKAKTATTEELMNAGKRQDKNDKKKFYNHDLLLVARYLGEAEEKPAKGKKATGSSKPAASSKSKAKDSDDDATEKAEAFLLDILADAKDNTVKYTDLSSRIVRKALENDLENDERDALRKVITDVEFLGREAGWTYDGDDKARPVKLAKKGKK